MPANGTPASCAAIPIMGRMKGAGTAPPKSRNNRSSRTCLLLGNVWLLRPTAWRRRRGIFKPIMYVFLGLRRCVFVFVGGGRYHWQANHPQTDARLIGLSFKFRLNSPSPPLSLKKTTFFKKEYLGSGRGMHRRISLDGRATKNAWGSGDWKKKSSSPLLLRAYIVCPPVKNRVQKN